jgi:hypothetical protein
MKLRQIDLIFLLSIILGVAIFYERALFSIHQEKEKLQLQKAEIATQKESVLARKMQLELQIMSQSDPRWITLTLIRVLGVVPEGETKYYFKER